MTTKDKVVCEVLEAIQEKRNLEKRNFYKTKILLKIYRKAVWSICDRLHDAELRSLNLGGSRLDSFLGYLNEHVTMGNKRKIEEDIIAMFDSKNLIEIIDKGLLAVKKYPDDGEMAFETLYYIYTSEKKYKETEILEKLNIEKTTLYKRRKKAIRILSKAIWGLIVPVMINENIKEAKNRIKVAEF
jgi:thiamine pyrophosphokinase